jgi:hypothetical protein
MSSDREDIIQVIDLCGLARGMIWAAGNSRVNETVPGVSFENAGYALRRDARARRLGVMAAIDAREGW